MERRPERERERERRGEGERIEGRNKWNIEVYLLSEANGPNQDTSYTNIRVCLLLRHASKGVKDLKDIHFLV